MFELLAIRYFALYRSLRETGLTSSARMARRSRRSWSARLTRNWPPSSGHARKSPNEWLRWSTRPSRMAPTRSFDGAGARGLSTPSAWQTPTSRCPNASKWAASSRSAGARNTPERPPGHYDVGYVMPEGPF